MTKIDELLSELDAVAREADVYDYGLPMNDEYTDRLRALVAEHDAEKDAHINRLRKALESHHKWHNEIGTVMFPPDEPGGEPISLDLSAEYSDSSLCEQTTAALSATPAQCLAEHDAEVKRLALAEVSDLVEIGTDVMRQRQASAQQDSDLGHLIVECINPLRKAFGEDSKFSIRHTHWEDETITVEVMWYGDPAEAESRMNQFDLDWWMANCHRSQSIVLPGYVLWEE